MHIAHANRVTVHIHPATSRPGLGLLAQLFSAPGQEATPPAAAALTPPKIGEIWPGMGGIYRGIARADGDLPDAYLIEAVAKPPSKLNYQGAIDWAKSITADGHQDFHSPSRAEMALLRANRRDDEQPDSWTWTSTPYDASDAWFQHSLGHQGLSYKSAAGGAVAVRRSPL